MKSSFRRALLSGALFILPVDPTVAAIGPDPVADEGMQSQDKNGNDLLDRVWAKVNVRNMGNEKYLASLMMWGQAFHAAPRSASISLSFAR